MAVATTETTQQSMTPQLWFEGGGQMEELQRISGIKDAAKRKDALQQFNEKNSDYLSGRISAGQPPPLPEKAKTHPAIDEAINDAMRRESDWMRDIGGMRDDELRHRYMSRMLEKDINRKRVEKWTTLVMGFVHRPATDESVPSTEVLYDSHHVTIEDPNQALFFYLRRHTRPQEVSAL